jgi:hypothetical protein
MIAYKLKILRYIPGILCAIAMGLCLWGCFFNQEKSQFNISRQLQPEMVVQAHELPQIGKWMFDTQYEPAYWLGEIYQGKKLQEPINIIILDKAAQSAEEAKRQLLQNFKAVGYLVRTGHSTGYRGYINGTFYEQIPDGKEEAFSNEPYETKNNHGRIFGPHPYHGYWLFIGAFSRESVDVLDKVKHRYESFNQARDDLSQRLNNKTNYKIKAFLDLDNVIIGNPTLTSGDHDGIAVMLIASSP